MWFKFPESPTVWFKCPPISKHKTLFIPNISVPSSPLSPRSRPNPPASRKFPENWQFQQFYFQTTFELRSSKVSHSVHIILWCAWYQDGACLEGRAYGIRTAPVVCLLRGTCAWFQDGRGACREGRVHSIRTVPLCACREGRVHGIRTAPLCEYTFVIKKHRRKNRGEKSSKNIDFVGRKKRFGRENVKHFQNVVRSLKLIFLNYFYRKLRL